MSADPCLVPEALVLPRVSYEEAAEMAYFGAKVIHPKTLLPVAKKRIPVLIKNTFNPLGRGTIISDISDSNKGVKAVTSLNGVSLINLSGTGMLGIPKTAGRLFGSLGAADINIIMISQASSEHTISSLVRNDDVDKACESIKGEFDSEIKAGLVEPPVLLKDLAVIAAVGEGMHGVPGTAGRIFGALGNSGVNVVAIAQGSSERNISLVVKATDEEKAVNAIHKTCCLQGKRCT